MFGGLWGAVVGDALGVPVEFTDRAERRRDPVISMRGGGTWRQPPGTWSDDSSLLLCTVESLLGGFDTDDIGRKFVEWLTAKRWTPWGSVFDIGMTTRSALLAIQRGTKAEQAGGTAETSNGNGSLMRILPVILHAHDMPLGEMLDRVHRASAITHGHPRSQMACGLYALFVRGLLCAEAPVSAWETAGNLFRDSYDSNKWAGELSAFLELIETKLPGLDDSAIQSGGYVMHTLQASLWCLFNSTSYSEAVLKAVNLGGDTDTTGCVTGGLAGLHYGSAAIPEDWMASLARNQELKTLFDRIAALVKGSA